MLDNVDERRHYQVRKRVCRFQPSTRNARPQQHGGFDNGVRHRDIKKKAWPDRLYTDLVSSTYLGQLEKRIDTLGFVGPCELGIQFSRQRQALFCVVQDTSSLREAVVDAYWRSRFVGKSLEVERLAVAVPGLL